VFFGRNVKFTFVLTVHLLAFWHMCFCFRFTCAACIVRQVFISASELGSVVALFKCNQDREGGTRFTSLLVATFLGVKCMVSGMHGAYHKEKDRESSGLTSGTHNVL